MAKGYRTAGPAHSYISHLTHAGGARAERGPEGMIPAHGSKSDVLRVGVGGPVGSGKTALVDSLCKRLRERYIAVVTNDIYTQEDAEFLVRSAGARAPSASSASRPAAARTRRSAKMRR